LASLKQDNFKAIKATQDTAGRLFEINPGVTIAMAECPQRLEESAERKPMMCASR